MTTKIETAKKIAKLVVGTSVGYTVGNIISHNTETEKRRHKAEAFVGGAVMGAMAADAAEDWTDRKIDEIVKAWNDHVVVKFYN